MESRFRPSIMKLIISSIISDILMPTEAYQCAVINARRIGIFFFLQDMCAILYVFFSFQVCYFWNFGMQEIAVITGMYMLTRIIPAYLPICLSIYLLVYLSTLPFCISSYISYYIYLSIYAYLPTYSSFYLPVGLSIYLLSVFSSICRFISIHLSVSTKR